MEKLKKNLEKCMTVNRELLITAVSIMETLADPQVQVPVLTRLFWIHVFLMSCGVPVNSFLNLQD